MAQFAGAARCRPMPGGLLWNCVPFQDRPHFESGQGRQSEQRPRPAPNAAIRRRAGRRLGNAATCPPIGTPDEGSGLADIQHRVRKPVAPPGGRRRLLRPPLSWAVARRDGRPYAPAPPTRRATGTAARPYRATEATITRNVTGRIVEAPPTCFAASCADKRRRGGRRDDAARGHPPGEFTFPWSGPFGGWPGVPPAAV